MLLSARNEVLFVAGLALALLCQAVHSENVPLDLTLEADSTVVHFIRGYVVSPGKVGLRHLKFSTLHENLPVESFPFYYGEDDEYDKRWDDYFDDKKGSTDPPTVYDGGSDNVETLAPTEDGEITESSEAPTTATDEDGDSAPVEDPVETPTDGGDRMLYQSGGAQSGILDIILFKVPADCASSLKGCDWSDSGVGAPDDEVEGELSYCCTEDTASRGKCDPDNIGRLILADSFVGKSRKLKYDGGDTEWAGDLGGKSKLKVKNDGTYVLLFANCNDYGRDILVEGDLVWESEHGILPGNLVGAMYFFAILAAVYLVFSILYGLGMVIFRDKLIPIQSYILASMLMGLGELMFKFLDYYTWNQNGDRTWRLLYAGITMGVLKRGLARCLGVMAALGWGDIRNSLGFTLGKIAILGLLYTGATLARDLFLVEYVEDVETLRATPENQQKEEELVDVAAILTLFIIIINLIFFIWIMRSLNATTKYLCDMLQTSKLRRHQRLKCIIITSFFITCTWLLLMVVDWTTPFYSEKRQWIKKGRMQQWLKENMMQVNYIFVLVGVGILWRPTLNSSSKNEVDQYEDDENHHPSTEQGDAILAVINHRDEGDTTASSQQQSSPSGGGGGAGADDDLNVDSSSFQSQLDDYLDQIGTYS